MIERTDFFSEREKGKKSTSNEWEELKRMKSSQNLQKKKPTQKNQQNPLPEETDPEKQEP